MVEFYDYDQILAPDTVDADAPVIRTNGFVDPA
jgi:hypothetical protein